MPGRYRLTDSDGQYRMWINADARDAGPALRGNYEFRVENGVLTLTSLDGPDELGNTQITLTPCSQ